MNNPIVESVAKALLVTDQKEALVLTIGEYKERPDKSFQPDLPGGLVDPGESERDAVVREIFEETGVKMAPERLRMVYSRTEFRADENKSVTKQLFIGRLEDRVEVTLSWEHSAYRWASLGELQDIELRSFYKEAIEYCFSNRILTESL